MILQSLHDLYERFEKDEEYRSILPPFGYSLQRVGFTIVLEADGSFFGIQPMQTAETDSSGRQILKDDWAIVPGGDKPTGELNPNTASQKSLFLRNDSRFLLGISIDKEGDNLAARHCDFPFEAFREKHLALEAQIDCDHYRAVCRFLKAWSPRRAVEEIKNLNNLCDKQGKLLSGVFSIRNRGFVHTSQAIKDWWGNEFRKIAESDSAPGHCMITFRDAPIARTHTPKIKGIGGNAQPSGTLLVSFDKDTAAYSSFGGDGQQAYQAPVSIKATFKYCVALSTMTFGPCASKHRLQIGDATTVFWTEKPTLMEKAIGLYFGASDNNDETEDNDSVPAQSSQLLQKIHGTLRALRSGGNPDVDFADETNCKFQILGLTGQSGGRIGIRFWQISSVGQVLDNLAKHHADLEIVRPTKNREGDPIGSAFPTFAQLMKQTAREPSNIPSILVGPLMRAALNGERYPDALATCVIRRIRADGMIDPAYWGKKALDTYTGRESAYLRAGILKAWLTRNHHKTISMTYDPTNKATAYRLGALFALLEKTQQDALGDVNAGIRDRFYSSASATPASVFPRLMKTYGHHLKKAAGDKKGFAIHREKEVQSIFAEPERMDGFPSHLNLRDQGLFAIGYYHKRKDLWTSNKTDSETDSEQESEP